MLISFENKFIFVHNYKVAGTSIKTALSDYGIINPVFTNTKVNQFFDKSYLKNIYKSNYFRRSFRKLALPGTNKFRSHLHATEIEELLPAEIFKTFFKFGFVRNPWDWQVSLFHFMSQIHDHHQHNVASQFESFDEYLEWRVNHDKRSQKDFFYDNDNNKKVNYIGKLETLNKDFEHICIRIGIECNLGHKNSSKRNNDYRKYYNTHTKNLVADHFQDDINLFDYEF